LEEIKKEYRIEEDEEWTDMKFDEKPSDNQD